MGFGLPSAIGAKIGRPDLEVWAVIGDGGFQMSSNELATAVQENLDINIAVINNGYLGMVRQWQDLFHAKNYSEVKIGAPNFEKLAEAYGITGITVRSDAEIRPAIERARAIGAGADRLRDRAGSERLADRPARRREFRDAASAAVRRVGGAGEESSHAQRSGRGPPRGAQPGGLACCGGARSTSTRSRSGTRSSRASRG